MKLTNSIIAISAIVAVSFSGVAFGASSEASSATEQVVAGSSLSRAEVLADLAIWNRAGMGVYSRGNRCDTDPEYQQHMAQYQKMRNGKEYEEELRFQRSVEK